MPLFHVYVLRSQKDRRFYIGLTSNLKRRVNQHRHGLNVSTKHRRPLNLVFFETFLTKSDAQRRERYFKTTKGKTTLRQMLREMLKTDTNSNVPG